MSTFDEVRTGKGIRDNSIETSEKKLRIMSLFNLKINKQLFALLGEIKPLKIIVLK